MLDINTKALLCLIRLGLNNNITDNDLLRDLNWRVLSQLAIKHGVIAIAVDGLQSLYEYRRLEPETFADKQLRLQMYAQTIAIEQQYQQYCNKMSNLLFFYQQHGIKTMLLKGYGLSLCYPKPNHRPPGDVDVYHFGCGGEADECMKKVLNITIKQNEDKHSTFLYKGLSVENHAIFVNDECHPSLHSLEMFFEKDAKNAIQCSIKHEKEENLLAFIPSVNTNALFIPLHLAEHFVHGEASLRQICDWYCFVRIYHSEIDWQIVEEKSKEAGFFKFLCILNAIVIDYLGADKAWFPQWNCDLVLKEKVFQEIISINQMINISLWKKIKKFFAATWKFRMVYRHENILIASLRQAKAYHRVKWNQRGISIWNKK